MPETENQTTEVAAPGQVISPGALTPPTEQSAVPETPAPATPNPTELSPEPTTDSQSEAAPDTDQGYDQSDGVLLSWTGTEFVGHQKTGGWYGLLALGAVALAGMIYLLTKDPISTGVIIIGAVIFGAYAARQPNQVEYKMNDQGVLIGNKYHAFDEFRSFSVVPEGHHSSIIFSPLKRFSPLTTIYYEQQDEEAIVNVLAARLPLQEHQHDAIDRLMNRIHF